MFNGKDKRIISDFLQTDYSDSALLKLKAAAERGDVEWLSGAHCLVGRSSNPYISRSHSEPARAYLRLGYPVFPFSLPWGGYFGDERRNKILLPLVNAEIERRAEGRKLSAELAKPAATSQPSVEIGAGSENTAQSNGHLPKTPVMVGGGHETSRRR